MIDFTKSHRRYNPLTGEWILVSPQRTKRPWQGKVEDAPSQALPAYDPVCYLCPGNTRAGGIVNPHYQTTFTFANDHPAVIINADNRTYSPKDFIRAEIVTGDCRVLCYTPLHNKTMAEMDTTEIVTVINTWISQEKDIENNPGISYVQIFENKGELMGASSQHPHCQIWATSDIPTIIQSEQIHQQKYFDSYTTLLLLDYLKYEQKEKERIVWENDHFTILVPFWAIWPYETMIIPKHHHPMLPSLDTQDIHSLADVLSHLTKIYDMVFNTPFPYSMGIHQAPSDQKLYDAWQMHFHFFPPLLRGKSIKKYMVGYEMLAEPQRDISPEDAASTLKKQYERI